MHVYYFRISMEVQISFNVIGQSDDDKYGICFYQKFKQVWCMLFIKSLEIFL